MTDLSTTYLNIKLKNPIIVGANNLVTSRDNLRQIEDAGAAAIVYKSLFEEQVQLEKLQLDEELHEYNDRHAEMVTLFPDIEHAGPSEHLMNLRLAKESVGIPVIASLNCIFSETWVDYAKQLQDTGVDALELNFFAVPKDYKQDSHSIISDQLEVIRAVKAALKIPVSVKLSAFYTNVLSAVKLFDQEGIDGFVLFNRFLMPDIDPDNEAPLNTFTFSQPFENMLPLRYTGLLYGHIRGSVCSNTGIHTGKDVAKMILAGADAVQVVSTLYKNKINYLSVMLQELSNWMESKHYNTLNDFRGKLSQLKVNDPFMYKRAQYIDILAKSGEIMKKQLQP